MMLVEIILEAELVKLKMPSLANTKDPIQHQTSQYPSVLHTRSSQNSRREYESLSVDGEGSVVLERSVRAGLEDNRTVGIELGFSTADIDSAGEGEGLRERRRSSNPKRVAKSGGDNSTDQHISRDGLNINYYIIGRSRKASAIPKLS